MQNHRSLHSLLVVAAAVMGLALSTARAQNVPVWTFTVPAATFASDTSSADYQITSDSAGNSFIVVQHFQGGINNAGKQLFLLNAKGTVLGGGDFPGMTSPTALYVSAKRVVVSLDGAFQQVTPNGSGGLTFTPLPTGAAGEQWSGAQVASGFDRKFTHTVTLALNHVSQIRRYAFAKLKP